MAETDGRERFCTIVFECNLRQFKGNPLHVDTPFGRPVLVAVGNVTEDRDWLESQLRDLDAVPDGEEE